jgi:hypothetical protein
MSDATNDGDMIAEVTSKLMVVGKVMAAVSAAVYACGLLVFHLYLGRFGIADFDVVAGRYLALGALFLIFVFGPLLVVMSGVIASNRRRSLVRKALIGLTASALACACLIAIWQLTIIDASFEVTPARLMRWTVPYTAPYGDDPPTGLAALSFIAMIVTVYLPVVFIWRMRLAGLTATPRLPITLSILLVGIFLAARAFGDSVAHIPAAFGGGYYGQFIVTVSNEAKTALLANGMAESPMARGLPVLLLHSDGHAVYFREDYYMKTVGSSVVTYTPTIRIAQDQIILMRGVATTKY